jgi:RNA polymerase sigma-70 factor, ECF subfamily
MTRPAKPIEDPEDFQRMYASTHLQVFRFVYGLHGGPAEEVEDITAETYLKAWRNRSSFSGDGRAALAWLFRIARNLVIDAHRRSQTRVLCQPLDEVLCADSGFSPEEQAAIQDQFRAVWVSLHTLPFEQREMIILRYMMDWSVMEIAAHLDMSENNVSVNLRRLLARLKQKFSGR